MLQEIVLTAVSPGGVDGVFGCVCDIQSGTVERTFKGEPTVKGGHGRVGSDLIVACHAAKPVINFWTWSKDQIVSCLPCPGRVTALQCTHDGVYCVAAISEKLYIWQLPVGNLLAVLCGHYQTVRVVKFIDDGSLFLSGGDDNLVLVWQTARVVSSSTYGWNPHPLHVWSNHSLPVTDIHCGSGGVRGHVFTSSLDQTCKIWEVYSGHLLCSIVFDWGITAVTTDAAEFRLFAGSVLGNVQQVNLYEMVPLSRVVMEKGGPLVFHGHSQQVTSLAVSLDGCLLVSGSSDATVRVWHVSSQQCLKVFKQKGPVAGVSLLLRPPAQFCHSTSMLPLKRTVHADTVSDTFQNDEIDLDVTVPMLLISSNDDKFKRRKKFGSCQERLPETTVGEVKLEEKIQQQLLRLQKANERLYQYGVQQLSCEMVTSGKESL